MTISEKMDAARHPSGFDYMRVALALGVIVWHAFGISYGQEFAYRAEASIARPFAFCILPMFFALSGFLVCGSLDRSKTLLRFLLLRGLRIIPALCFVTLFSALVIGPAFTNLGLAQYFKSAEFKKYLLTAIGLIHDSLPGVFDANPLHGVVNGQLSSISAELKCYGILAVLGLIGALRYPRALLVVMIALMVGAFAAQLPHSLHYGPSHNNIGRLNLMATFFCGAAIYANRDIILWSGRLAAVAASLSFALFLVPSGDHLIGIPLAYVTVYVGLTNPRKVLINGGDYSYGLYLYGFVIQQSVASLGAWALHWYVNAPISIALTSVAAVASWHLIEEPAMKLKATLPAIDRALDRLPKFPRRRRPSEPASQAANP